MFVEVAFVAGGRRKGFGDILESRTRLSSHYRNFDCDSQLVLQECDISCITVRGPRTYFTNVGWVGGVLEKRCTVAFLIVGFHIY